MTNNQASPLHKFGLLLVASIGLMIIDHKSDLLKPARSVSSFINFPFEGIVRIPIDISTFFERYYPDNGLYQNYQLLKSKQVVLEARLQRFEAIEIENRRLSKLLSASRWSSDEVLLSEIINSGIQPFNQKIVINRGVESGVYLGQPAISPEGVLGQVSNTGYLRSVVTLITDPSHGLPVQIQRNGLRTIIHGAGKPDKVILPYLENQADIEVGDVLVTSGMGGRFPVGYKVGIVIDVIKDANEPFLKVTAETTAQIGYTKEALLLWNANYPGNPRPPHPQDQPDG